LAAYEERSATLCRANSLKERPQFWTEEMDRYLDRAYAYRLKAKALR
jgi:hypothetical protein